MYQKIANEPEKTSRVFHFFDKLLQIKTNSKTVVYQYLAKHLSNSTNTKQKVYNNINFEWIKKEIFSSKFSKKSSKY